MGLTVEYKRGLEGGRQQERERIINDFVMKRWFGYDATEAPNRDKNGKLKWVYLRHGGTREDWEVIIGKP